MSQSETVSRRDAAKASTRRAIIDAALERFGVDGFAGSPIQLIALDAGVTTGAIYHHFRCKRGLFLAAACALEEEIVTSATAAAASGEADLPWLALQRSMFLSLEISSSPRMARILFQEAPSIIGPAEWRAIQHRFTLGALTAFLDTLSWRGRLGPAPVWMLAHMLIGALSEGASAVATSNDPAAALIDAKKTMGLLLKGIELAAGMDQDSA